MDYEFFEKVSVSKQVIKRDTLKIYDIEKPESILDGLRHEEQISLLSKVKCFLS